MFRRLIMVVALVAAFAGVIGRAEAGEQYVDDSGYALSGYDPVAYFELEQAPVGTRQAEAVPGKASITAEYNGAKWAFATDANRSKFLAAPERYRPQFDGHCAYGVVKGGKVPGNPNLWRIVEGKLYVNITPNVVGFWEADIPGNIATGTSNWAELESKTASKDSWKAIKANEGTFTKTAPVDE